MKKYVILSLLILPLTAFGAPSVRKLGVGGAVPGTSAAVAAPRAAVPAKATSSASAGSNAARVGSLRARATTAGLSGAMTGATARFPKIVSVGTYNTANTLKPASAGASSVTTAGVKKCDVGNGDEDVCDILDNHEGRIGENEQHIGEIDQLEVGDSDNLVDAANTNAEDIEEIATLNSVSNKPIVARVNMLITNADSVKVVRNASVPFDPANRNDDRAWFWIEDTTAE